MWFSVVFIYFPRISCFLEIIYWLFSNSATRVTNFPILTLSLVSCVHLCSSRDNTLAFSVQSTLRQVLAQLSSPHTRGHFPSSPNFYFHLYWSYGPKYVTILVWYEPGGICTHFIFHTSPVMRCITSFYAHFLPHQNSRILSAAPCRVYYLLDRVHSIHTSQTSILTCSESNKC